MNRPTSADPLPPLAGEDFLLASDEAVAAHAGAIFAQLHAQARPMSASSLTRALAERTVLGHSSLSSIVAAVLAEKLRAILPAEMAAFEEELVKLLATPRLLRCTVCDLYKIVSADPASDGMLLPPLLFYKGVHALCLHRIAHALWSRNGPADRLASLRLQSIGAELFSVDIHPAAQVGPGVMLDHASGVVIGSTALVGSDVYMLHQVTLGSTGKPTRSAKRHPTIGDGVTLGAGATVLGDIIIGRGATVGAGAAARDDALLPQNKSAVVTRPVPPRCTVVGVNKVLFPRRTTTARNKPADSTTLLHGQVVDKRDGLGGDMLTPPGHPHPPAPADTAHDGTPPALRSHRTTIQIQKVRDSPTQAGAGPPDEADELCRVAGAASLQGEALNPTRLARLPRSRL